MFGLYSCEWAVVTAVLCLGCTVVSGLWSLCVVFGLYSCEWAVVTAVCCVWVIQL